MNPYKPYKDFKSWMEVKEWRRTGKWPPSEKSLKIKFILKVFLCFLVGVFLNWLFY